MKTSDFEYDLPPELIAREPTARRDACRLLVVPPGEGAFEHRAFTELPELLRAGDLLVLNDTRVMRARLVGTRPPGGGRGELLLLEPVVELGYAASGASPRNDSEPLVWDCLARPGAKLRAGARLEFGEGFAAEVIAEHEDGRRRVRFALPSGTATLSAALERLGHPPLPPYILAARRTFEHDEAPSRPDDAAFYQTVFAREGRSVAAPTAGLHFTDELLAALEARGVEVARLRLDVGAGTFKPVEVEEPRAHPMHTERYEIEPETADAVNRALREGRRVVAVGTTALRALESAATEVATNGAGTVRVAPGERATDLLILPGDRLHVVSGLVTNFHLPRSTLLMLVAAVSGRERILAAYAEAIARRYRFYSYGDAMLLWNAAVPNSDP